MLLENPLFLVPATTAPFLILVGFIMLKWPPKEINSLYGYRTKRSMKNQMNWDFSQPFSAKKLILWGFIYLLSAGLGFFSDLSSGWSIAVSLGILIVIIIIMFYQVESAIKRFENEGS